MMTDRNAIRELGATIAKEFDPDKIVLFGSHAYGDPSPDSDVDLLVIMEFEGKAAEKAAEIRLVSKFPFPIDILVRTPAKVRERIEMGDVFMREAVEKGLVIYERNNDRVGAKGGRRLRNDGTRGAGKKKT